MDKPKKKYNLIQLNCGFEWLWLLHLLVKPRIISRLETFYGGPLWSPRNRRLLTPPGPEGSNGSSYSVCRGVAIGGHRHSPFAVVEYIPIMVF